MLIRNLVLLIVAATTFQPTQASAQRPRKVSWVNPDIPDMKGLNHHVLASKSMGHDVGYVVWTPPDFDSSGTAKYPVIYFLHGAGGSEKSDSAGFSARVAAAIRSGKMRL